MTMSHRDAVRRSLVVAGALLAMASLLPAAAMGAAEGGTAPAQGQGALADPAASIDSTAQAASSGTTITGTVEYRDHAGNLQPARQVRVLIRKDNVGPSNPVIASTRTDDNGRYSVTVDVAEHETGGILDPDPTLHLRIQALSQNPAVNVISFQHNVDTANGNTWTLDRSGQVDRGQASANFGLTATRKLPRRAFQVANWSLEAYRFTERETGWTRKRVKARYPANNDNNNQFKSPLEKFVIGDNGWDGTKRHTVHHEYGHAVMSGLFRYRGWQIPKATSWGSHCSWSDTGRIMAWYEGFAEFFEAAVVDNPRADGLQLEGHHYYNETADHPGVDCPESNAHDGYDGAEVEGAVANVLWDVYDPANEPHDDIDGTLGEVFDAVNETDNRAWGRPLDEGRTRDAHDFFVQYVDETGRHEDLRKIYFEYGVVKPDRFDSYDSYPTVGACTVHQYPCDKMAQSHATTLSPDASVDAIYHDEDTDPYVVEVTQNERVNVSLETHGGNADLDFALLEGGANSPTTRRLQNAGSKTRRGDVVSQSFSLEESKTVTITVEPAAASSGDTAAYTLTVETRPEPNLDVYGPDGGIVGVPDGGFVDVDPGAFDFGSNDGSSAANDTGPGSDGGSGSTAGARSGGSSGARSGGSSGSQSGGSSAGAQSGTASGSQSGASSASQPGSNSGSQSSSSGAGSGSGSVGGSQSGGTAGSLSRSDDSASTTASSDSTNASDHSPSADDGRASETVGETDDPSANSARGANESAAPLSGTGESGGDGFWWSLPAVLLAGAVALLAVLLALVRSG